jgi:RloB-like protein
LHRGIRPGSFDQVYVVFDRDDHVSYHNALHMAQSLDGKFRNDSNERILFTAVPSIPSFELWLLLH